MILIDSNILIDVFDDDQEWRSWSVGQLVALVGARRLVVNQIAYAEVAPRMGTVAEFRAALASFDIEYEPLAKDAAFLAGQTFQAYRARRSSAGAVLPDFFIGGHAQTSGATVLTRDTRLYRTYFPTVPLITPETTS